MNVRAFIDTNVFIYIQRTDDLLKKRLAEQVVNHFDCVASTQVLNEICNIFTKKYPTPRQDIALFLQDIKDNCAVCLVTEDTINAALMIHERWQYSYYDALIVASALAKDCAYLISEDLQDGQIIDGRLQIVNVFQHPELLGT
ncbi:ribonuclease VapC [Spirochaetia bacterium]|nr:ribonuclease VapC [Spirochaetia bacterium]